MSHPQGLLLNGPNPKPITDWGSIEWKSYIYGDYAFHYIVDQTSNLWFVCMAERALMRRVPFAFLQAVQETFMQKYTKESTWRLIWYTQMHQMPEWNYHFGRCSCACRMHFVVVDPLCVCVVCARKCPQKSVSCFVAGHVSEQLNSLRWGWRERERRDRERERTSLLSILMYNPLLGARAST